MDEEIESGEDDDMNLEGDEQNQKTSKGGALQNDTFF